MGTAPRSPAQLTSVSSRRSNPSHAIESTTASGRATSTRTTATPSAPERLLVEVAREHQQAEQEEQADLGGRRQRLEVAEHGPTLRRRPVGDHHPRHVDGEEPGRAGRRARRRRRARPAPPRGPGTATPWPAATRLSTSAPSQPTADTDQHAAHEVAQAEHDPVGGVGVALPCGQQADGEHHRHRVVGARLDLEQVAQPPRHGHPAQRGEDRGRVGGRDDRADEQRGGARRRRAAGRPRARRRRS